MDLEALFFIPQGELIVRQLHLVAKIVRDERWLEGERRGQFVSETDPIVNRRACEIVERIGHNMRLEAWFEAVTDRLSPTISDETWYESEVRRREVAPSDPAVVERLKQVLLRRQDKLPEQTLILIIKRYEARRR